MARTKGRANGDGDVYPRKNKEGKITSYRGAYVGPDGKRRYVSGKTKEETRKALREARSNADAGLVFEAGSLTVGEYLDRWLADSVKDTVRQRTYERYESITRVHIKPAIGRLKLKALTPAHARALYRQKLDSGLSPRTVNYIHVTLHKALSQAVSDGLVQRNTAQVKAPRPEKPEIRPLSPDQARKLVVTAREIGDRYAALYVVALHTGLREGEMLGLRWDDVDLGDQPDATGKAHAIGDEDWAQVRASQKRQGALHKALQEGCRSPPKPPREAGRGEATVGLPLAG